MNQTTLKAFSIVCALVALCGCGAHTRESRLPADVVGVAIAPVDTTPPDRVLTPEKNVPITPPQSVPAPRPMPGANADWPDSIPRPRYGEHPFVDEKEEALEKVLPAYPSGARDAGVDGTVLVGALVGIDGRVHDVIAVHSIPALNEAAFTAVRACRFKPAMAHGKPVAVWVEIPVKFSIH